MRNLLLTLIIALTFIGCGNMKIENFANTTPELIPEKYFQGEVTAYGLVKNRSGEIIRTFKGDLNGSFDELGNGTLKEKFIYDDGEIQHRKWIIKALGNKNYEASASDVVGTGSMEARGNSLFMRYTLTVPYNNSTIDINIDDWLHLQEDGVIINHSKMKKFGFVVGELVVTMIKK